LNGTKIEHNIGTNNKTKIKRKGEKKSFSPK